MKRMLLVVLLCGSLCGCATSVVKAKTEEANLLSGAYVKQLDKTTPAQDKEQIKAMDAEMYQIDAAVRGTEKAAVTRALLK